MLLVRYFLYFVIYSVIGWIMEVIVTLVNKKKFVNRGFLIGPYCPIYGFGVVIILLLIGDTTDFLAVFLKAILICSVLEYFTSWYMEKLFNVRYWDYSSKKFNINGRICLETMVPFGLLALFIIYVLQPRVAGLISLGSNTTLIIVSIILFLVLISDYILSTYILLKIKGKIKYNREDNTEKIKKYVEKWLMEKSYLYRRIKQAFPKYKIFKKNS